MQIANYLQPYCIALHQHADSLQDAADQLVRMLDTANILTDPALFTADIRARIGLGGVCMGNGLAIPHAKSSAVQSLQLAAMTLDPPLVCSTPDGKPLDLILMIAAPAGAYDLHVQVLADLAALLLDKDFCAKLRNAPTPEAFRQLIIEQEKLPVPSAPLPDDPLTKPFRLLGVTACPTGVAHTYLAAEALQKSAQAHGVSIKVETNGAAGVDNALTEQEIIDADCIILAADRAVSTERFVGKRLLVASAGEAVRNADALLDRALGGKVPVYRGRTSAVASDARELGREGYRHLMNGISHMLPFIVSGGVLLALSLLLQHLGLKGDIPTMMTQVGNAAFKMMYPVLAAFIASSIADKPAFMPGLMGGYLAQVGTTAGNQLSWISSGFWGAIAAGFAAGLLVRLINILLRRLPGQLDSVKSSLLIPLLGLLGVGALMVLVVNPPLGRFNNWLSIQLDSMQGGSRLVLGTVLGALMATDYGGPINKAAYVSGTLALVNAQYDIMAAVMVGGMVPPTGVALACLLFPTRFTADEVRTAPQNLLMGFSFVTEGALPFALKDPLRVGPACILGSALSGLLAVMLDCGCPAPHGGLFLLPVMGNPLGFLAALAAGSLFTALLLGLLKKPVRQR